MDFAKQMAAKAAAEAAKAAEVRLYDILFNNIRS